MRYAKYSSLVSVSSLETYFPIFQPHFFLTELQDEKLLDTTWNLLISELFLYYLSSLEANISSVFVLYFFSPTMILVFLYSSMNSSSLFPAPSDLFLHFTPPSHCCSLNSNRVYHYETFWLQNYVPQKKKKKLQNPHTVGTP